MLLFDLDFFGSESRYEDPSSRCFCCHRKLMGFVDGGLSPVRYLWFLLPRLCLLEDSVEIQILGSPVVSVGSVKGFSGGSGCFCR